MNELFVILRDLKWINATTTDRVSLQCQDFCGITKVFDKKEFKNFSCYKDRPDDYLVPLMMAAF